MEHSPTISETGIKATRNVVIKVASSLIVAILTIECVSLLYLIYTLGLHRSGRWIQLLLAEAIVVPGVIGIMVFFCLRWARGTIEFGRVLSSGEEPTRLQTENCVRSVFSFARNGGIFFVLIYSLATAFIIFFLRHWYEYSSMEIASIAIFKSIIGLNLGVILYYAIKILEQFRLDQSIEKLFEKGIYEWPHFRLKIRYKIFLMIFTVVAYLLCGAVLMGSTQIENIQRAQLRENLDYWVKELPKQFIGKSEASVETGVAGSISSFFLEDQLGAHARMVMLSTDGAVIRGDASALSADEIKKITSSKSAGEITDYARGRLLVYTPQPAYDLIAVAVGHWEISTGIFSKARFVIISLLFATIFLSIVATFLLVSEISTPVSRVLDFLRIVSSGETGAKLNAYSEDEMGDFAGNLARTTTLLEDKTVRASELLKRIEEVAGAIEENAEMAQVAARQQAGGASEQASAVEEALSTSNEIVATARQITENATDVRKSAEENLLSCKTGKARVEEALEGFRSIGTYVEKISNSVVALGDHIRQMTGVMEVIGEVAIQINLLSLNAQVEAAVAGEEGKRFGMVVEEVRRLADNTMDAIKQLSAIVNSTIKSTEKAVESAKKGSVLVSKGAELADEIGQTLNDIERQATSTETASRKIAITTTQQKTSSEQMAETISEINESAQQIKSNTDHVLKAMAKLSETAVGLTLEFRENR